MDKTTILEVVVGSTLHGTAVNDGLEDLDLMAIVIESPRLLFGFFQEDTWTHRTKPEGVRSEAGDVDHVAYGLRKYLGLATKGNPTILLALFASEDYIREIDWRGWELRSMFSDIVSKQCFAPFRGYMRQQHERLLGLRGGRNVTRPELVDAYGYDTKYAAHIVRLGLQGEELLTTGKLSLPMQDAHRELVVKVRTGGFSLVEISNQIADAENRLVAAHANSTLADRPNVKKVQEWMIQTYMDHWHSLDTGTAQATECGQITQM